MSTTCQRVRELAPGYVLGALEPAEMLAVREHLDTCKNPHPEMRELGGVVAYLGLALDPVEPPASIKSAVMAAAKADLSARKRNDEAAERLVATLGSRARVREAAKPEAAPEPAPVPESTEPEAVPVAVAGPAKVVPMRRRLRPRQLVEWAVSLAAAIVLLVGTGIVIGQNNAPKPAGGNPQASEFYQMIHDATWKVNLQSPSGTEPSGVAVRLPSGDLKVLLDGVSATSGSEVYQIWLVANGGEPVAVGGGATEGGRPLFTVTSPLTDTATTILVTKEKAAGAKTPSLPAVLTGTLPNGAPTSNP